MDEKLYPKRKQLIKIFLIIICVLLFYIFALSNKGGKVNPVGESLQELIAMGLLIVVPLFFAKKGWHNIALYFLLVVPLTIFGGWWTHYSDLGGLIFIYYDIVILVLISVSYLLLKFLYRYENSNWLIPALVLLIVIVFIPTVVNTYYGIIKFNKHFIYNNLRCNGNSVTLEQFERDCNKLTGEFWEGYYRDICFRELENRKRNGAISYSFNSCSQLKFFPAR